MKSKKTLPPSKKVKSFKREAANRSKLYTEINRLIEKGKTNKQIKNAIDKTDIEWQEFVDPNYEIQSQRGQEALRKWKNDNS